MRVAGIEKSAQMTDVPVGKKKRNITETEKVLHENINLMKDKILHSQISSRKEKSDIIIHSIPAEPSDLLPAIRSILLGTL